MLCQLNGEYPGGASADSKGSVENLINLLEGKWGFASNPIHPNTLYAGGD
jgi:hypothetical protein